jgi:hypothetical protein
MEQKGQAKPEEQEERTAMCICPICGGIHHMPWGPMRTRRTMPWGRPWGGLWGGPWGWGMRMGPMGQGLLCMGPALLGFAIGVMVGRKGQRWRFWRGW